MTKPIHETVKIKLEKINPGYSGGIPATQILIILVLVYDEDMNTLD